MSEQPKRVGRPAKKPELGPRKNVTFRLNEQVMDRVQAFAAEHGRSASEEIERRIEASFHDDDAMRVIRETIRQEMRAEFAARRHVASPMSPIECLKQLNDRSMMTLQDLPVKHTQIAG